MFAFESTEWGDCPLSEQTESTVCPFYIEFRYVKTKLVGRQETKQKEPT